MKVRTMKIAVILFNLGGPTDSRAVRPFLFNLFKDKNIIRLPAILRYPLAYLISSLRYKKASRIYAKLGGGSPINIETKKQADALEKLFKIHSNELNANNNEYEIFYCMQYWHPMHLEVIESVKKSAPDTIILLPLYPQFSTTTTKSSFQVWYQKSKGILSHIPHINICCYPQNAGFIKAYGALTLEKLKKSNHAKDAVILYSAHGIPQDCVEDGDPYEEQITKTANAIQDYLKQNGFENDFMITYQSKVGPKKWLTPDTQSVITQFAKNKKSLVIVPLAFTSEHSETLVELDMDYQELALSLGCPDYMRVPAVTDNVHFINGLKDAVLSIIENNITCNPSICSDKFKECPKKNSMPPCITI